MTTLTPTDAPTPIAGTSATFVARTPTDLIAIVPAVLGFHPQDSVVLLTFGPPGGAFHARVDLPVEAAEQEAVADVLVDAVAANRVRPGRGAALHRRRRGRALAGPAAARPAARRRVEVIDVLRVDDGRWHPVPEDGSPGTAYELETHPFTAQRVFEGQVVHRDREELADSLVGTDEEDAVEVALAATRFADLVAVRRGETTGSCGPRRRWLQRCIRARVERRRGGSSPRRGATARAGLAGADPRRRVGRDHPGDVRATRRPVARAGASQLRATCCRERARCWRSPPGSTVTAPSPGARSTDASRSTPTTRWPTAWPRC